MSWLLLATFSLFGGSLVPRQSLPLISLDTRDQAETPIP